MPSGARLSQVSACACDLEMTAYRLVNVCILFPCIHRNDQTEIIAAAGDTEMTVRVTKKSHEVSSNRVALREMEF